MNMAHQVSELNELSSWRWRSLESTKSISRSHTPKSMPWPKSSLKDWPTSTPA